MNNSRAPLIVGVVLALGVMLGLNVMQQRNDPKAQEQLERLKQEEEAKKQSDKPVTSQPSPAAPLSPSANQLAQLGEVATFGPAKAPTEIVVGWEWTPEVQADPSKVYRAVEAVQQAVEHANGRLRARIVNIDANPSVAPGITIGNTARVPALADGSINTETLMPMMSSYMGH